MPLKYHEEPIVEQNVGEPAGLKVGSIITAGNGDGVLQTYAKVVDGTHYGYYNKAEIFAVIGEPVMIEGEALVGGSSSFGVKAYIPTVQIQPGWTGYTGGVQYIRVEDNSEMREACPRFRVTPFVLESTSLVEIQGLFQLPLTSVG